MKTTVLAVGRRRVICVVSIAAAVLLLGACESIVYDGVDSVRQTAGVAALARSPYLQERARVKSAAMCAAHAVTPSADPNTFYGGETALDITEFVGSEPLDPTISDPQQRDIAASRALWERVKNAPAVTEPQWDEIGVGDANCPDGNLYMTIVARVNPTMPATGRYSTRVYTGPQITVLHGLVYGQAVNSEGVTVDLLLDLYLPPDGGPSAARPTVIMVHGGGFQLGSRDDNNVAGPAKEYARRGFVGVSIDYRLRVDDNVCPEAECADFEAARDAIDDGMESVRWLKANAATYGIDAGRIAMTGYSAGGATSLGAALMEDPTPGGPLAAFSPKVAAAVSTGAHLTPALDHPEYITFHADAPTMMFHYDLDTSELKVTADYAYRTCSAAHDAGVICDFVRQPGVGHVVSRLGPGPVPAGNPSWWTPEIGPFLWYHLKLADLPQ